MPDDAIASQARRPARRERRAQPQHLARGDIDDELRERGRRQREQHGRDFLALADEMPRALVGGVGGGSNGHAHAEDLQPPGAVAVGDPEQDRHQLRAEHGDRVLAQCERRREHDQHRVRERERAAVFETQRQQLAEHEAGGEERQGIGAAVRIDQVRDGSRGQTQHAHEDDSATTVHRAPLESRSSSRISCYSAAFAGRKRRDRPFLVDPIVVSTFAETVRLPGSGG